MKKVAIAGTFDTKGNEFNYLKERFEELGVATFMIHTGSFEPKIPSDITSKELTEAAGENYAELVEARDRGRSVDAIARGMEILIPELYQQGKFDGIISLGGSGGTSLVAPAMRALPVGVPKIIVSTMAGGNVAPYVGTSDIILIPSIVDVAGLNRISTTIFDNAVHAMVGMLQHKRESTMEHKPMIAATMFGVTTPCVNAAQAYLEAKGYEVLVFHATGAGGKSMESLIDSGYFAGVLDITTTEWCDELFGGELNAGPNRLEAAGKAGIPQVVSLGALDMVNFGPIDSMPEKYQGRKVYKHNPTVTLMRTTKDELVTVAKKIAEKLNQATGPTILVYPLKGLSSIDTEGQVFEDAEARQALFDTLDQEINPDVVKVIKLDNAINDVEFAEQISQYLVDLL